MATGTSICERCLGVHRFRALQQVLEENDLANQEVKAVEENDDVELGEECYQNQPIIGLDQEAYKVDKLHDEGPQKDQNNRRFQRGSRYILVQLAYGFECPDEQWHQRDEAEDGHVERAEERQYRVQVYLF